MRINTIMLAKAIVVFSVGFWLALAVLNNITDIDTNLYFMKQMLTMDSIKSEPILGKKLMWHAINLPYFAKIMMYMVIIVESITTFLLLWASARLLKVALGREALLAKAISLTNLALIIFFMIWIWFLCGDIWFAFWIKAGAFAQVHSLWIIISLLLLIFINNNTDGLKIYKNNVTSDIDIRSIEGEEDVWSFRKTP